MAIYLLTDFSRRLVLLPVCRALLWDPLRKIIILCARSWRLADHLSVSSLFYYDLLVPWLYGRLQSQYVDPPLVGL